MERGSTIFDEDEQLVAEIKALNEHLRQRLDSRGSAAERRRQASRVGQFLQLRRLAGEETSAFFQGSSLTGIDGSVNTFGANYPYLVTLFRALARSSRTDGGSGERVWIDELFSPLLPRCQAKLQERIDQGLSPEEALARLRWETLARLEARAGLTAVEKEKPRLLLWDGGFARLETHASDIWEQIRKMAVLTGVVMLGVTEEISTSSLKEALCAPEAAGAVADRELLYGLLEPGECYQTERGRSNEQKRVYVRFAAHRKLWPSITCLNRSRN